MQMLQNHAGAQKSMGAYGLCVYTPGGIQMYRGAYEHMGVYKHRGHPDTPQV